MLGSQVSVGQNFKLHLSSISNLNFYTHQLFIGSFLCEALNTLKFFTETCHVQRSKGINSHENLVEMIKRDCRGLKKVPKSKKSQLLKFFLFFRAITPKIEYRPLLRARAHNVWVFLGLNQFLPYL